MNSIAKFGIIYTSGNAKIENSEFINNKVLQQLIFTDNTTTLINNTFKYNHIAGSSLIDNRGINNFQDNIITNNNVTYELIDNWNTMNITNSHISNNTGQELIGTFGNMTITHTTLKNNNINDTILRAKTLYYENSDTTYLTGNITITNNKIFLENTTAPFDDYYGSCEFTLINNTIYGQHNYKNTIKYETNIIIPDNTLYGANREYNATNYKEIYINGELNYEITDKNTPETDENLNDKPEKTITQELEDTTEEITSEPAEEQEEEHSNEEITEETLEETIDEPSTGEIAEEVIQESTEESIDISSAEEIVEILPESAEEQIEELVEDANEKPTKQIKSETTYPKKTTKQTKRPITTKKPYKTHKQANKIIIKLNTPITLSWLNSILNEKFNNETILIYIGNMLVFNGTVSDDSSQELFKVLEEYKGEQTLKVVSKNKTYTKNIQII